MLHPSTSQTGEDNKLINESGYHDIWGDSRQKNNDVYLLLVIKSSSLQTLKKYLIKKSMA